MAATLKILEAAGAALEIETIEIGEKVYLRGNTAGIDHSAWDSSIDPPTGQLGTLNCAPAGAVLCGQQQRQFQAQVEQIADLQQRLSRLESLIAKQ